MHSGNAWGSSSIQSAFVARRVEWEGYADDRIAKTLQGEPHGGSHEWIIVDQEDTSLFHRCTIRNWGLDAGDVRTGVSD
jgi:hypothetical protein